MFRSLVKPLHVLIILSLLLNSSASIVRAAPAADGLAAARPHRAPVAGDAGAGLPREHRVSLQPQVWQTEPASADPADLPAWWQVPDARPALSASSLMTHTLFLPLVARDYVAPPPTAEVEMSKAVSPWLALPGDEATYTLVVTSTGGVGVQGGTLVDTLPAGLELLDEGSGRYDPQTGELSWSVGALAPGEQAAVSFRVRVTDGAAMSVVENAARFEGSEAGAGARLGDAGLRLAAPSGLPVTATATTALLVGEAVTGTLTPAGGPLASPQGRVQIQAPAGAVDRTTEVVVADYPLPAWQVGAPDWKALFSLQATGAAGAALADEEGHTRFLQPLTVTVDLNDRIYWMDAFLVHFSDATGAGQQVVTSTFDSETGLLTASLTTFSPYGAEGRNPFPEDGSHFLFQDWPGTDLYSGGLSYQIPIQTPAGPGGMGPQLSLSYSSRSSDGVLGVVQSSEAGWGWSVGGVAQIVREVTTHDEREIMWEYDPDYTLMLGTSSHHLVGGQKLEDRKGCRYYTQERSGIRVMLYNDFCGYDDQPAPENQAGEYWIVTTPGGTKYRFGFTANSEHVVSMAGYWPEKCWSLMDGCGGSFWEDFDGYAGDLVRYVKRWYGRVIEIVKRSNLGKFVVLPKRWIVERTFAWLSNYRRLSKDYESNPQSSESMIRLAMINLMLHRLRAG